MLTDNRGGLMMLFPALLLLVLAALPLFTGVTEFTGDDYYYIVNNPLVTTPDLSALLEIWRRPMKIEYFPLTITSYALEFRLWGGMVKLYHLTNVALFLCIGLAARSLALRLTGPFEAKEGGAFTIPLAVSVATIICLLHPVNVESVASISNRKELLCVLFGLLSLRCHLAEKQRPTTTAGTIFFMVCAQLSKGSAIIVPLLLLLGGALPEQGERRRRSLLPVAACSIVAAIIFAVQFQVALHAGVVEQGEGLGVVARVGGVIRLLNVMLVKFFYPVNLSYDYDLLWPKGFLSPLECLLPLLTLLLLCWLAFRRNWRLLLLTLLVLASLLPYSNIVPLRHNVRGQMVFYDHYLLFATMLSVPLLARLLLALGERWRTGLIPVLIILTAVVTLYDYRLHGFWKTRETLYQRIIAVGPKLPKGYLFLGKSYNEQGRYAEAIPVLEKIFTLENWFPTYVEGYRELGDAYAYSGRYADAERAYRRHLEYQPKDRGSLQNLSSALIEQRKCQDARAVILQWLAYYPDDRNAGYNLGICEQMPGQDPINGATRRHGAPGP